MPSAPASISLPPSLPPSLSLSLSLFFCLSRGRPLQIGVKEGNSRYYCCTEERHLATGCRPIRSLIVNEQHQRNGSIELIRIPVPRTPGLSASVARDGYVLPGRLPYTKYKVT